jgi:saposin
MVTECDQLVDKYSEELIDMLVAEYTPEEVCTNLKMCGPKEFQQEMITGKDEREEMITGRDEKQAHIETNEIVLPKDDELVKAVSGARDDNKCVICEFVMTQLDDMLKNNATEVNILFFFSLSSLSGHFLTLLRLIILFFSNNSLQIAG